MPYFSKAFVFQKEAPSQSAILSSSDILPRMDSAAMFCLFVFLSDILLFSFCSMRAISFTHVETLYAFRSLSRILRTEIPGFPLTMVSPVVIYSNSICDFLEIFLHVSVFGHFSRTFHRFAGMKPGEYQSKITSG